MKTILIMPGTALVYVPLLIHYFSGGWPFGGSVGGTLAWIIAEGIAFNATALLGWAVAFCALNTAYFIASEEPALAQRFGRAYLSYKSAVPRWLPNRRPYEAPDGD